MERSAIVPHISWSGPQPDKETDAYLLAMLLRIYASDLDCDDESKRDVMAHPSVLTTDNLGIIAIMYAFYKDRMEEAGARNTEGMLRIIKATAEDDMTAWMSNNTAAVRAAEGELIEYVDTPNHRGFSAFG